MKRQSRRNRIAAAWGRAVSVSADRSPVRPVFLRLR